MPNATGAPLYFAMEAEDQGKWDSFLCAFLRALNVGSYSRLER
jgi:hypothetical protein